MGHAPIVVVYVRYNCDADVYACYTITGTVPIYNSSNIEQQESNYIPTALSPYSFACQWHFTVCSRDKASLCWVRVTWQSMPIYVPSLTADK